MDKQTIQARRADSSPRPAPGRALPQIPENTVAKIVDNIQTQKAMRTSRSSPQRAMDLIPTLPTKSPSRAQQQRKPQEQPLTPEHPVPDYRTSHYDALPSSITASALPHKDRATILRRKKEQLLHLLNQRETMGQKVQQLSKQLRALPKQIGNVQTDIDAMEAVESDANGAEVMTESEDEDWLFAPRGQKSSDVLRQLEMS